MKTIIGLILIIFAVYALKNAVYSCGEYLFEKYGRGKHFCHKCRIGYVWTDKQRSMRYCEYCGNELVPFVRMEYMKGMDEIVFEEFETKEEKKQ